MFQVRTFQQITAAMIRHMMATQQEITDFHIGSVARTLVEAPAIEMDAMYQRVLYGLLDAIPAAVYHAFGFDALPAAKASGSVDIYADALQATDRTVPAATVLVRTGTDQRYFTVEDAVILAGTDTVTVRVEAEFAGLAGNAGAYTLTGQVPGAADLTVLNGLPITGGREEESTEERKVRFVAYINSLSRATPNSLIYAAQSTRLLDVDGVISEYVARVGLEELAGRANLYILGSGGAPTAELITAVQNVVDGTSSATDAAITVPGSNLVWTPGYRAAGVQVVVAPMDIVTVDITMNVSFLLPTRTIDTPFRSSAATALDAVLGAALPGGVVQAAELVGAVLGLPDVHRVIYDTDANLQCGYHQTLRLGILTLNPL